VEDDSQSLAHSLMPINLAAELVWARVYQASGAPTQPKEDVLNSIATTLSVLGEIYEYDANPKRAMRRLSRSEIEGGRFTGGARELQFIDGRPPRRYLGVRAEDVATTIVALKREITNER
jgi:hypothetical protein